MKASPKERSNWEICGGGYGIHWPAIDEDLSTEGLLRGIPAPKKVKPRTVKKIANRRTARSRPKRVKQKN